MALVIEGGGGDYTSVSAALIAGVTNIEIQGTWTSAETWNLAPSTGPVTITATGSAKHPGYVGGSPTHWRHRPTSGHAWSTTVDLTVVGLDIGSQSTGTSDEIFRLNAVNVDLVATDCLLWFNSRNDQQDVVYNNSNAGCSATLTNCHIWNVYRSVVGAFQDSMTVVINSCHCWNCSHNAPNSNNLRAGLIGASDTAVATISVFNTLYDQVGTYTDHNVFSEPGSGVISGNAARMITSASSIDNATVTTSLTAHTWTDDDTKASDGDWVIVQDITSAPYNLSLATNAFNEAQDAHGDSTGAGVTMPATDIIGTSRPQNTNYDIGAFEISAGGSTYQETATDGFNMGEVRATNIDMGAVAQDGLSMGESPLNILDFFISLSDGITASDNSSINVSMSIEVSDTTILSDSTNRNLFLVPNCLDGIKMSESLATSFNFQPVLTDTITVSDETLNNIIASSVLVDGISLSDSDSGNINITLILSDGVVLSDESSFDANATYTLTVTDGLNLSEALLNNMSISSVATDGISLSDVSLAILFLLASNGDGINFSDSSVSELLANILLSATDGISLGDSTTTLLHMFNSLSDGTLFSDSVSPINVIQSIISDGVSLSDSSVKTLLATLLAIDGIKLNDTGTVKANFDINCQDQIQFGSALASLLSLSVSVSDIFNLSDENVSVVIQPTRASGAVSITIQTAKAEITVNVNKPSVTVNVNKPSITVSTSK